MIEPSSERPTQSVTNLSETATKWLLEPALIVTAVTAVFYAAGHLVYLRDAARLGIPADSLARNAYRIKDSNRWIKFTNSFIVFNNYLFDRIIRNNIYI